MRSLISTFKVKTGWNWYCVIRKRPKQKYSDINDRYACVTLGITKWMALCESQRNEKEIRNERDMSVDCRRSIVFFLFPFL